MPVIAGAPPHADRAGAVPRDPGAIAPHLPAGLPPQLNVWVVAGGSPTLVQTLTLNREEIADDMSLVIFRVEESVIRKGRLPETWWTSYERAKLLGLGADIDLGPGDPAIDVLVVTGLGDRESADLVAAHAASGRLAVLAPGTPTNTVDGEATAELGRDPDAWIALAGADVATQPSSTDVVLALGGTAAAPEPLQGGDLDHLAPGARRGAGAVARPVEPGAARRGRCRLPRGGDRGVGAGEPRPAGTAAHGPSRRAAVRPAAGHGAGQHVDLRSERPRHRGPPGRLDQLLEGLGRRGSGGRGHLRRRVNRPPARPHGPQRPELRMGCPRGRAAARRAVDARAGRDCPGSMRPAGTT